jgi:hypothetical protein
MSPDYTGFKSEIYEVEVLASAGTKIASRRVGLLPNAVTCYGSAAFPALISW